MTAARVVLMLALPAIAAGLSNAAAQTASDNWPDVKCTRYGKAWSYLLTRRGRDGLSQEFIDRHEAFLASRCTARAEVCPRSSAELDVANKMVILAMNAGTASTFPPFSCRKVSPAR